VTDGSVCLNRFGRVWCPRNYSGGFRGRTNFTTALVKSINTIPVRLYVGKGDGLKALGGKRITAIARAMGVTSPLVENPPMVLGANGLTVLEMASGYGTFMSGGHKLNVHTITQIHDTNGNLLFDYKKQGPPKVRALSDTTVASMNKMLVQVPEWGTARRARLEGIRAAGKTGTTQAYRDAWFVGYTGNFVAAVWFGNDNYKPTKRLTGGRLPAMTWKKFMSFAHQNIEIRPIPYVDPIEETEKTKIAKAKANQNKKIEKEIIRPKTLSRKSEDALRALEKILKSTPLIKLDRKIADIPRNPAVQSN
jgi:penicillin-binding protein 1A